MEAGAGAGPENQNSQHMLKQPRGISLSLAVVLCHPLSSSCSSLRLYLVLAPLGRIHGSKCGADTELRSRFEIGPHLVCSLNSMVDLGEFWEKKRQPHMHEFGCTPKMGRTGTYASKKGSEKVLGRVLGQGSQKGSYEVFRCGFTVKMGSEKGSSKGFLEGDCQKVPRTPPPQRVRPLRRAPCKWDL